MGGLPERCTGRRSWARNGERYLGHQMQVRAEATILRSDPRPSGEIAKGVTLTAAVEAPRGGCIRGGCTPGVLLLVDWD